MLRQDMVDVINGYTDSDGRKSQSNIGARYFQEYSDVLRPEEEVRFLRTAAMSVESHLLITTKRVIFFGNGAVVLRIPEIDSASASPMEEKVFPHRRSVLRITARGASHRIEFYHNRHAAEAASIISRLMLRSA